MSKNKNNHGVDKLREWQDHQYNPGYWVNRIPFGFPPKRSKGYWLLSLIDLYLLVPAFILFLLAYLSNGDSYMLIPLSITGAGALLAILRSDKLKPPELDESDSTENELVDEPKKKEKKKKLPKMRKDYH